MAQFDHSALAQFHGLAVCWWQAIKAHPISDANALAPILNIFCKAMSAKMRTITKRDNPNLFAQYQSVGAVTPGAETETLITFADGNLAMVYHKNLRTLGEIETAQIANNPHVNQFKLQFPLTGQEAEEEFFKFASVVHGAAQALRTLADANVTDEDWSSNYCLSYFGVQTENGYMTKDAVTNALQAALFIKELQKGCIIEIKFGNFSSGVVGGPITKGSPLSA